MVRECDNVIPMVPLSTDHNVTEFINESRELAGLTVYGLGYR